jgi:hypothetical protein
LNTKSSLTGATIRSDTRRVESNATASSVGFLAHAGLTFHDAPPPWRERIDHC